MAFSLQLSLKGQHPGVASSLLTGVLQILFYKAAFRYTRNNIC
jgi:hypothetical protein